MIYNYHCKRCGLHFEADNKAQIYQIKKLHQGKTDTGRINYCVLAKLSDNSFCRPDLQEYLNARLEERTTSE